MMPQSLDPRDDLAADHVWWESLLAVQYARDGRDQGGLFGVLHGFRCEGARLVLDGRRLRIEPGEIGEDYPLLRRTYLMPRRNELTALLAAIRRILSGICPIFAGSMRSGSRSVWISRSIRWPRQTRDHSPDDAEITTTTGADISPPPRSPVPMLAPSAGVGLVARSAATAMRTPASTSAIASGSSEMARAR